MVSATPAGSARRWRETIGDLDLLVETETPEAVIEAFHATGVVERVGGHGGRLGTQRTTVQLLRGPQADVMTYRPGTAGTYLLHFTGSAAHNVRLRARARDLGWSLSEHGFARLAEDGAIAEGADAEVRTFATEAEAYAFLGLPFIEPELREDRGEIEAALAGTPAAPGARSTTSRATATPTPTGPTGTSRSRRWRRRPGAAATPTRC